MEEPVVYDKAKWHYGGDYPEGLDESQAYIHTGFFLGWLIEHDLLDPSFIDDVGDSEIERFKARDLTAPKLFELWDGALVDDMLNEEGNAFAHHYFVFETGQYLADYERLLLKDLPTLYHVQDSWENYDLIRAQISKRYAVWKKQSSKKWWEFWR